MTTEQLLARTRFNWLPASYADESWFSKWFSVEQIKAIRACPKAVRHLNQYFLGHPEALQEVPDAILEHPLLWQLLKDIEQLPVWINWLGLASNHERIRKIICAKQQRQIKDLFGEAAYRFTLERAAFLSSGLTIQDNSTSEGTDWGEAVRHAGILLFSRALSELPPAVTERIKLMFPMQDKHYFEFQSGRLENSILSDHLVKVAQEINTQ